ncbi:MAG: protein translocase subunit SecF, partial [Candidatus Omnitrophica bacterium]|nr:protein translocase subunit SecF [Candidatus Omnitrophota bacterium]
MVAFIKRGENNYGIDFTGGTIQQFKFTDPIKTQDVRNALKDIGLGGATIQQYGNDREVIV